MTGALESLLFFALGMAGGTLSGLLGIGGGIIMLPLLVTVPSLAGIPITVRAAVGITMLQSLIGSGSAVVSHLKERHFHLPLVLAVGGNSAAGALGVR